MSRSSECVLRRLWARASTLEERLSGLFEAAPGGEEEAEVRAQAWAMLAGGGDEARAARRLAFAGLSAEAALPMLGRVVARADAALPAELALIGEALHETEARPDEAPDPSLADLPFIGFHAGLMRVALRALLDRLGDARGPILDALGPAALQGCLRGLAERLSGASAHVLYTELEGERARGGVPGGLARLEARWRGEARLELTLEYAAMSRSLGLIALQWVEASAELLERLFADREALVERFGAAASGPPVALSTALGDPHRGGRGVARLRFPSGLDLYYKPRDLSLDLAFAALLQRLAEQGAPHDLVVPRVLARPGYGWAEGVVAREAADEHEVRSFFERGGALLGLAWLLDLTDCHSGNLIAAGAHPVLIDLETVFHHRARDLDERYSDAERRARRVVAEAVTGTGLLPAARLEGEALVELGGLSPGHDPEARIGEARWVGLGTDGMRREVVAAPMPEGPHLLRFRGQIVSVRDHAEALQRGFVATVRTIEAHREAWLDPSGPLAPFQRCEARFVFRGTLVYGALLERITAPELSREGVDRSLLLDVLARSYLDDPARPSVWPVLHAERAALQAGDVPHFTSPIGSSILEIDGAPPIQGYLVGTAMDRVRARIAGLCEPELDRQLRFIRGALARPLRASVTPVTDVTPALGPEALREAALEIAADLWRRAERGSDGSMTWIEPTVDAAADAFTQRPMPLGLGDGVAGVLLFAAALESTGAPEFVTELRQGALRHLQLCVDLVAAEGISGLTGAASVAYALARAAALARAPEALTLAAEVVARIPLDAIEADTALDLTLGAAGTLLALAAVREVAEARGDAALVEAAGARIRAAAARLGLAFAEAPEGVPTVAGRVLTGVAHGQAGFALAVSRLRPEDGAEALRPLLDAALAFERAHYNPEWCNWPDRRPDAATPCACAWCHGAPGIGASRAALLEHRPHDAALREELRVAARTTAAEPLGALDHLCCGNMSLAHALQIMGVALDDPALTAQAVALAQEVVGRAKRRGGYHTLIGEGADQQALGLFTGLAGVGLTCLRLVEPSLPSPLVFG